MLLLGSTTRFVVMRDRLVIRRVGMIWRTVVFDNIENIEVGGFILDRMSQIRIYRLGLDVLPPIPVRRKLAWGKVVRITCRKGVRYILINPVDPQPLMKAFNAHLARRWSPGPRLSPNRPLPEFLRPR
ncbi:hypothetical protein JQ557_33565 [Bradyrhizobium sp. U87765 SZCCT0131]|uniref:hypothetical protein n=1 Tax=unclassified Bradyrhizobium TaxID=2631580 RepID=UPI001BADEE3F|nr:MULTISPECIES: hypothetical protein [unclassified Bradyrhizobium]MBR1222970.1 hypothetical protein [Bradyrhizobium sp. U87765 SZCCT0131]MBR1262706.1 hypothetical protein [Bradyrhizobium sp. U87765 SZCCT0134]MBR1308822.1 hypothetical protein [Bradyrhizobium sp. U87765 SZCCT0110]MBR1318488.1 hypothetical protein [Bradyrhizobium sp. U87765 SZCCT0109]MBR1352192.1 hypothetical protein [Bradyrhizobium sp. U87765 SZCCT0048]